MELYTVKKEKPKFTFLTLNLQPLVATLVPSLWSTTFNTVCVCMCVCVCVPGLLNLELLAFGARSLFVLRCYPVERLAASWPLNSRCYQHNPHHPLPKLCQIKPSPGVDNRDYCPRSTFSDLLLFILHSHFSVHGSPAKRFRFQLTAEIITGQGKLPNTMMVGAQGLES